MKNIDFIDKYGTFRIKNPENYACPSGAMDLQGFSNRQIIAEVDAICR